MKALVTFSLLLVLAGTSYSQLSYNRGFTGGDAAGPESSINSVVVDDSGNYYCIGTCFGSVDFNPYGTPDTINTLSTDAIILKYDVNGNLIWGHPIGGAGHDFGIDIGVDSSGNVVATGTFNTYVDFDPSPAVADTFILHSAGANDIFILKLDPAGNFLWANQLEGGTMGTKQISDLEIDASGNIYATGFFNADLDMDPSAGTLIFSPVAGSDAFVIKLDATGNLLFAHHLGGQGSDSGNGIELDNSGNYYLTGNFSDSLDFDPGAATATMVPENWDGFIARYSTSGTYDAAIKIGGPSNWDGISDLVFSPDYSQILVTGSFEDSVDFNPNGTPFNMYAYGFSGDVFMARYDLTFNLIEAVKIGSNNDDDAYGIRWPNPNGIYFFGKIPPTGRDLEPHPLVTGETSNSPNSYMVSKYDGNFNHLYAYAYEGLSSHTIYDIDFLPGDRALISGKYYNEIDLDFGPAVDIHTSPGTGNYFFQAEYAICSDDHVFGATSICPGDSLLVGTNYYTTEGVFYDSLTNLAGCDSITRIILTIDSSYIFTLLNDTSICDNDSILFSVPNDYISYTWSGSSTDSSYLVLGADLGLGNHPVWLTATDPNGCSYTDTTLLTINLCGVGFEARSDFNIRVFPNPVNDIMSIDFGTNQTGTLSLLSVDGRILHTRDVNGSQIITVDLTALSSGNYLIIFENETRTGFRKLVKQ